MKNVARTGHPLAFKRLSRIEDTNWYLARLISSSIVNNTNLGVSLAAKPPGVSFRAHLHVLELQVFGSQSVASLAIIIIVLLIVKTQERISRKYFLQIHLLSLVFVFLTITSDLFN